MPIGASVLRRKRLVRLHLKEDPRSIEGVLVGEDARHYRLANAKMLSAVRREDDTPIDGEAWWPRADVLYVQVLG